MAELPEDAFLIFDNPVTKKQRRLTSTNGWAKSAQEECGRAKTVQKHEQVWMDFREVYRRYGHTTERAIWSVVTWRFEGAVLREKVKRVPLLKQKGTQASLKVSIRIDGEACEVLWHRVLAYWGPSERVGVPADLTWRQFERTWEKVCKDGKRRKKHVYEVEHTSGNHLISLVELMEIQHHKDHRKSPRAELELDS